MITPEELKKIAGLAKLSLDGADVAALAADIGRAVDFANIVAGADLAGYDLSEHDEEYPLREDETIPSLPPEVILRNAGETRDGFFVARRQGGGR